MFRTKEQWINYRSDLSRAKRYAPVVAEDVVIVVDSGLRWYRNCETVKVKLALKNLINKLEKVVFDTRYAMVTAGYLNFKFTPSSSAAHQLEKTSVPWGTGLEEAMKLFDASPGHRSHAKKIVLLFTDGLSSSQSFGTHAYAKALKDNGVEIFVAGIGYYHTEIDKIVQLTSSPADKHIYKIKNVGGSYNIVGLGLQKTRLDKWKILPGEYELPC
ncbi:Matrilin-3 [Stylophora pistillata]|uniref:Matrilin-3 n=1 Tax=Stylophora pistillata TaxID=50429 RepID=A0A2B4R5A2_STYPI|nr:Matrilin-3 [Stylophora pistillata]